MPLNRLFHDPDTPRLAMVLALVLLAQALLPAQIHTRVVAGPDGVAWQICTLADSPQEPEHPRRDSAAVQFSQLAAELLPGAAPVVPGAAWRGADTPRGVGPLAELNGPVVRINIRAPPPAATFAS